LVLRLPYILKKHVLNEQLLKNDSDLDRMFHHDQARAHRATATREILEEYKINFNE
jgi:hypothetical protein